MNDTSLVDSSLLTALVLRSFMNRRLELCPAQVGADRIMPIPHSWDSKMNISLCPSTVNIATSITFRSGCHLPDALAYVHRNRKYLIASLDLQFLALSYSFIRLLDPPQVVNPPRNCSCRDPWRQHCQVWGPRNLFGNGDLLSCQGYPVSEEWPWTSTSRVIFQSCTKTLCHVLRCQLYHFRNCLPLTIPALSFSMLLTLILWNDLYASCPSNRAFAEVLSTWLEGTILRPEVRYGDSDSKGVGLGFNF